MAKRIRVKASDGTEHVHVESWQNGRLELRETKDGGLEVVGITETPEISREGGMVHSATRIEKMLGTYPPGSSASFT